MSKVDIVFCTHNRAAMTAAALYLLVRNTDWSLVNRLLIYDDLSADRTPEILVHFAGQFSGCELELACSHFGGPVGIMQEYLENGTDSGPATELFIKLDNDTCVPPGWLGVCLATMEANAVDLLGIEPFSPVLPWHRMQQPARQLHHNAHIGGIGLMRRSVFDRHGTPAPRGASGRFGFTEWQHRHEDVIKAFIDPALPVALLDRVPVEPWVGRSKSYVDAGWARKNTPYPDAPEAAAHWQWIVEPLTAAGYMSIEGQK